LARVIKESELTVMQGKAEAVSAGLPTGDTDNAEREAHWVRHKVVQDHSGHVTPPDHELDRYDAADGHGVGPR
jgi:hypothetical protein